MTNESIENEIAAFAEDIAVMDADARKAKFEAAKEIIGPKSEKLKKLNEEKVQLEVALKAYSKQINAIIDDIRKTWMPFITGVTECDLALDNGLTLQMKEVLKVSADDKSAAIEWFKANGYEGVMKWDIHHQTMSAIAREKYTDKEAPIEIPGLKYSTFPVIKIKS